MPKAPSHRVIGADTVRALATLWVFAGHLFVLEPALKAIDSPWTRLFRPGYLGVAAFFVLSGFLLSMPFWRAFSARLDAPDFRRYFRRRLARIVPEYYVCVLVMALIGGAFATRWGLIQVAGCLTFTNALLPPTYMPTWNAPLWSIGIEMSFYLFLPIVAVGIFRCRSRLGARVLIVSLMGLIALGQPLFLWAAPHLERMIGNESLFSAGSSSTVKNAVVLFAHFLIGMLAADVYLSRPIRSTAKRFRLRLKKTLPRRDVESECSEGSDIRAFAPLRGPSTSTLNPFETELNTYDLLVLIATSVIGLSLLTQIQLPGLDYMHYQWPTFPILIGVLLVCLPHSAICGRWIEGRFIRTTATLSYGIYIWHIPILTGLKHVWPSTPDGRISLVAVYALTSLVCCYAVSAISYRFVGKPALDWMRLRESKHTGRPILPPAPRKLAA